MSSTTSDIQMIFKKSYDDLAIGIIIIDLFGDVIFINSTLKNYMSVKKIKNEFDQLFSHPGLITQMVKVIDDQEYLIKQLAKRAGDHGDYYVYMIDAISEIDQIIPTLSYVRQQETKFQNILDCIHDRIYVVDGQGYIIMVNKAAERDVKSRDNLVGRHMSELVQEGYMKESLSLKILKNKMPQGSIFHEPGGFDLLSWGIPHVNNGEIDLVVCTEWDLENLYAMKEYLNSENRIPPNIRSELAYYRMKTSATEDIIAESSQMKELINTAARIARADSTVLIQGESGTGKEVLMKYIHSKSPRINSPLIEINCGAMPDNLVESELFGYEKGAFTGADSKGKPGLFEMANLGTLFLDEIGDLPLQAQTKLLRALQEKEVMRVGGNIPIPIDVRIIAASNINLSEAVEHKQFRKDLFYRLNVIPLYLPPLRRT